MNKFVIRASVLLLLLSCSAPKHVEQSPAQTEDVIYMDFADKLSAEQLAFIRKNYNWNNERSLIVNYSQPVSSCHFNNNRITNSGKKFWEDFYSKVNTENSLIIKVLANGEKISKKLDNEYYFDDKDDFLLNNFFNRKKSCYGVMVVNNQGYYIQYNGHYSERQVNTFIHLLNQEI